MDRVPDNPLDASVAAYLADCRGLVLTEIADMMPRTRHGRRLYELMSEYPLRGGKALRPALCVATCRALGGHLEAVTRSAAAIELYHNAFLVHDDVEDGSELRRSEPTLHRTHGVPIAVNVGDGMLAVSMAALLDNTALIGVGRALRVLDVVSRMARESAEGQMIELDWIAGQVWSLSDEQYIRMVYKKTTWYSFVTPVRVGAIAAGAADRDVKALARFGTLLGVAFQIQDDVLNLTGGTAYGKEIAGDLWEGKRTLMLIHAIRCASPADRARAIDVLARPRPSVHRADDDTCKCEDDIRFLQALIDRHHSIEYARSVATRHATRAARTLTTVSRALPRSSHIGFLEGLIDFVVRRVH